ncbi:apolipoprotein C-I [Salminus brasiliensis]|uniref:apolipoprotein C-I n=1 Tax=Salminus brasiliensis TaxID=930266 RepID=UPI003B837BD6
MRLYLAVAALMLVLATHAEAQEEPTIEQHFANFHSKIKEFGSDLTDKTMATFKEIEQSEFATKTRNWFSEQFEKMKQKIDETFTN